jgi:hypothetical protein
MNFFDKIDLNTDISKSAYREIIAKIIKDRLQIKDYLANCIITLKEIPIEEYKILVVSLINPFFESDIDISFFDLNGNHLGNYCVDKDGNIRVDKIENDEDEDEDY